jgi:hypothetical protein
MKTKFVILIFVIMSVSCKSRITKHQSEPHFSQKDKDTITKIISNLYGDWISTDKEILNLYQNGFYNCHMTISKSFILRDVDEKEKDKFENVVDIMEILPISATPVDSPEPDFDPVFTLIKKHYPPDSFQISVLKKDNYFGLLYQDEELKNKFVPIKFLDNNLLILVDGREFKKIN